MLLAFCLFDCACLCVCCLCLRLALIWLVFGFMLVSGVSLLVFCVFTWLVCCCVWCWLINAGGYLLDSVFCVVYVNSVARNYGDAFIVCLVCYLLVVC